MFSIKSYHRILNDEYSIKYSIFEISTVSELLKRVMTLVVLIIYLRIRKTLIPSVLLIEQIVDVQDIGSNKHDKQEYCNDCDIPVSPFTCYLLVWIVKMSIP